MDVVAPQNVPDGAAELPFSNSSRASDYDWPSNYGPPARGPMWLVKFDPVREGLAAKDLFANGTVFWVAGDFSEAWVESNDPEFGTLARGMPDVVSAEPDPKDRRLL